jgi:hypothetical protein
MNSATPVAGAVVSSSTTADTSIVSGLTRAGEYAVGAPPGRYRLAVKRIGVRRFVSVAFDPPRESARRMLIDAVALTLPEVTVSVSASPGRGAGRIASLWEEARAGSD